MARGKNNSNSTSDSNATNDPNKNNKEELLLEFVMRRCDGEWQMKSEPDSKAGGLIGYVSIVTGVVIGLGTFSITEKLMQPL